MVDKTVIVYDESLNMTDSYWAMNCGKAYFAGIEDCFTAACDDFDTLLAWIHAQGYTKEELDLCNILPGDVSDLDSWPLTEYDLRTGKWEATSHAHLTRG